MVEQEPTAAASPRKRKPRVNLSKRIAELRRQAAALGHTHYDPMEPCSVGHVALRGTKSNECVECVRIRSAQRRGSNPNTARRVLIASPGQKPNRVRRQEARVAGQKNFVSAVACAKCGTFERRVSSNNCVECQKEYTRNRNITHAEEHRAAVKAWQSKNQERVIENRRRWYLENMEKAKANVSAWYRANTERARERSKKHREDNAEYYRVKKAEYHRQNRHRSRANGSAQKARMRNAQLGDKRPILAFCKFLLTAESIACYWCREDLPVERRQIDHIIPLQRGGPHSVGNLCVSCPTCNNKKGTKLPHEFAGQAELHLI